LVGLGPKFLDSGFQPSLDGSPQNLHASLVWGQALNLLSKNFYPTPKKFGRESLNLADHLPTRHQSEARNFKTAQHIEKQKSISFIYDKCIKNGIKLGASANSVWAPGL